MPGAERPGLDPEIIARAVAGGAEELERLLRAIEPELRSEISIRPLWRRSVDADDILQVSCLEAFLRISSLVDATPAGFRAWMRRLVRNNLTDAIRALERDKRPDPRRRLTRGAGGESARTLLEAIAGGGTTAAGAAARKEQLASLQRAVARLPALRVARCRTP